jgi:hypothetical protein
VDCNLNHDAILIRDADTVVQVDSQRQRRDAVPIRDMDYTAICDWLECDYTCVPTVPVDIQTSEDTTYDAFSARWRVAELKKRMRAIFARQTFYRTEDLLGIFADVPRIAYLNLLRDAVDNKNFRVTSPSGLDGYIRYCNGYYVFQPYAYTDIRIPLSIRAAKFPVRRDEFTPDSIAAAPVRAAVDTVPIPYGPGGVQESKESDMEERGAAAAAAVPEPAGAAAAAAAPSARGVSIIVRALPAIEYDYVTPWTVTKNWIGRLVGGEQRPEDLGVCVEDSKKKDCFPKEIRDWINHVARDNNAVVLKLTQVLQVVVIFVAAWRHSGAREPARTKDALLNYFWDNWLTNEEQLDAAYRDIDGAKEQFGDSLYRLGTIDVLRVINYDSGDILYYCRNRTPCTRAIRDEIERDKDHPTMASAKISERVTGFLYGFLAPKEGKIVFKTNNPPEGDSKLGRGSECGNVSTTRDHIKKIESLFDAINATGNLGRWSREGIVLENSVRTCTFMEFLLRWMNAVRVNGKMWFYRPVQAKLAGHAGLFRSGAGAAAAAAKK